MAWIESHESLGSHPKTETLAKLLHISTPAVVGHLHFLWWWALTYAEDGNLTDYPAHVIAMAAKWDGDADVFLNALIGCRVKNSGHGFVQRTEDDRLIIHDWPDYAGRLLEKRRADADRLRSWRERKKAATSTNNRRNANETRTSRVYRNTSIPLDHEDHGDHERDGNEHGGPKEAANPPSTKPAPDGALLEGSRLEPKTPEFQSAKEALVLLFCECTGQVYEDLAVKRNRTKQFAAADALLRLSQPPTEELTRRYFVAALSKFPGADLGTFLQQIDGFRTGERLAPIVPIRGTRRGKADHEQDSKDYLAMRRRRYESNGSGRTDDSGAEVLQLAAVAGDEGRLC